MNRIRFRARAGAAAATVIAFVLLIPATPASADTVGFSSPSNGSTSTGSTVTVSGSARFDPNLAVDTMGISSVSIKVTGPTSSSCADPVVAPVPTCNAAIGGTNNPSTSFSISPSFPYNGPYSAVVVANASEYLPLGVPANRNAPPQTGRVSFNVGVKPAPPSGVKAVANSDRTVTVSWSRNPEPDILGYQVQRVPALSASTGRSQLSWTDADPAQAGGQFTYFVYALRPGADGTPNHPLSSVSGGAAINVPAPPPPPTTLPADGSTPPPPLLQVTPTTAGAGAAHPAVPPALDLSGFLAQAAGHPTPAPKVITAGPPMIGTGAPPEADPGFQPTLPFPLLAGRGSKPGQPGAQGALSGQPAGSSHPTGRTILLPFAAGLFLCVLGVHIRWFNQRLADDNALAPVEPEGDIVADSGGTTTSRFKQVKGKIAAVVAARQAAGEARRAAAAAAAAAATTAAAAASAAATSAPATSVPATSTPATGAPATGAPSPARAASATPLDDEDVLVTW